MAFRVLPSHPIRRGPHSPWRPVPPGRAILFPLSGKKRVMHISDMPMDILPDNDLHLVTSITEHQITVFLRSFVFFRQFRIRWHLPTRNISLQMLMVAWISQGICELLFVFFLTENSKNEYNPYRTVVSTTVPDAFFHRKRPLPESRNHRTKRSQSGTAGTSSYGNVRQTLRNINVKK